MKDPPENYLQLNREIIWHGGHGIAGSRKDLKAGLLSMIYENGSLRHISVGTHEIVRMIYMAVRDREWLTVVPRISEEEFSISQDSFRISYHALYSFRDISYSARFFIEGHAGSYLSFKFKGEALTAFEKNRIGFCVLHPVKELAGKDCLIQDPNSDLKIGQFPSLISPHQPFSDITLMQWNVNGLSCRLDFYGDIFETEDQRNWTDASYKTYCTPLHIPYPVAVNKGEKHHQKIVLRIKGSPGILSHWKKKNIFRIDTTKIFPMPRVGTGRSSRMKLLTENEISRLKLLRFDHYRVDLYLFSKGWENTADEAVAEAEALGYRLEFGLFFDENASEQAAEFIKWALPVRPKVSVIIIYHRNAGTTPDRLTDTISPLLMDEFPGVLTGCGTNANFAQLNRERPNASTNDLVSYAIHPQEHASDNLTLTENLEAQAYTAESAHSFICGKGLWISPVTIRRRFNANIENFETPAATDSCPPQVDSRMMSLFGASWTAGSMKYLLRSGIKGVTYHEAVGERGIMQGDFPSGWPDDFPSAEGMIFPVFHVFRFVLGSGTLHVVDSNSSDPLLTDILALSDGRQMKLILMNFTEETQVCTAEGITGKFIMKELNAGTWHRAAYDPEWLENSSGKIVTGPDIALEPFSVNFLEETIP